MAAAHHERGRCLPVRSRARSCPIARQLPVLLSCARHACDQHACRISCVCVCVCLVCARLVSVCACVCVVEMYAHVLFDMTLRAVHARTSRDSSHPCTHSKETCALVHTSLDAMPALPSCLHAEALRLFMLCRAGTRAGALDRCTARAT